MNARLTLPVDIFILIANEHHISDAISLATAIGIKIDDYMLDSPIKINDTITLISDEINDYKRIIRMWSAKVSGKVILYHIKKQNVDILRLLDENCRIYYKQEHILSAVEVNSVDVISVILPKTRDLINKDILQIVSSAINNNSFETLKYIFDFNNGYELKSLLQQFIIHGDNFNAKNVMSAYEYFNIDFKDDISDHYYKKGRIEYTKFAVEKGLYFPSIDNIINHMDVNYLSLEMLQWCLHYISQMPNFCGGHINYIFEICVKTNKILLCAWMIKNYTLNLHYKLNVNGVDMYRFLTELGFDRVKCSFPHPQYTGTCKNLIWYHEKRMKEFKTSITMKFLCYFLEYHKYEVFMHFYPLYTGVDTDEFFYGGDVNVIKFLLNCGTKMKCTQKVFEKKIIYGDLESLKFINANYKISGKIFNSNIPEDVLKWLVETFESTNDDRITIIENIINIRNIDMLMWFLKHYDVKIIKTDINLDVNINKKIDINLNEKINKKIFGYTRDQLSVIPEFYDLLYSKFRLHEYQWQPLLQ